VKLAKVQAYKQNLLSHNL